MLPYHRRSAIFAFLTIPLLLSLTGCANSPTGKAFERSLAVDPLLKDNPVTFPTSSPSPAAIPSPSPTPTLAPNNTKAQGATDIPEEIPRYPKAQLQQRKPPTSPSGSVTTVWRSSDRPEQVQSFYQKQFQDNNWQILNQPDPDQKPNTLKARQGDLQVSVSIQPEQEPNTGTPSPSRDPADTNASGTEFVIEYVLPASQTATTPTDKPSDAATPGTPAPNQISEQFQQYIADLEKLGVLTQDPAGAKNNPAANPDNFQPNKTISRREYAAWLVAANNKIHANRPAQQIRLASPSGEPAFPDVPVKDPDFPVIQGLAEAGIIPSPLTGDSKGVLFRPNAPLTREQLILWKVPLDARKTLPTASVDAVQQTWGFQDAAKIDPKALRAVLADFQNGDLANIRRSFGYTTLFQPKKTVTRAEAAATLWYFGVQGEGLSAQDLLQAQPKPGEVGEEAVPP